MQPFIKYDPSMEMKIVPCAVLLGTIVCAKTSANSVGEESDELSDDAQNACCPIFFGYGDQKFLNVLFSMPCFAGGYAFGGHKMARCFFQHDMECLVYKLRCRHSCAQHYTSSTDQVQFCLHGC